jgi:hypothetical protein
MNGFMNHDLPFTYESEGGSVDNGGGGSGSAGGGTGMDANAGSMGDNLDATNGSASTDPFGNTSDSAQLSGTEAAQLGAVAGTTMAAGLGAVTGGIAAIGTGIAAMGGIGAVSANGAVGHAAIDTSNNTANNAYAGGTPGPFDTAAVSSSDFSGGNGGAATNDAGGGSYQVVTGSDIYTFSGSGALLSDVLNPNYNAAAATGSGGGNT